MDQKPSKKPVEKTIVDLKLAAQVHFTMLYVGARSISKQITKSTLLSMSVLAACTKKPAILYDPASFPYTFEELASMGQQMVRASFTRMLEIRDVHFYEAMMEFDLPKTENREELYTPLAISVLKKYLPLSNLRETDLENIAAIVAMSESDYASGTHAKDYEITTLGRMEAPYTCYIELNRILNRYSSLCKVAQFYNKYLELFFMVLEDVSQAHGWRFSQANFESYQDNFDQNLAFFSQISSRLHDISLAAYMSPDELWMMRWQYLEMLRINGTIGQMKNCCSKACKVCIPDNRVCTDVWMKNTMLDTLRQICFIDYTAEVTLPTLQEHLLDKKTGGKLYSFERGN